MMFALIATLLAALPTPAPNHPTTAVISRPALRLSDAEIFGTLDAASASEIEAARLASGKASSKAVKDYADMLIRDHAAARKAGSDLAKQVGVTPVPPSDNAMATAHAAVMARLSQVSGAAFDKAFMQAMADDHRMVIDKVNSTLIPSAQNARLKEWMGQLVPTLQNHLAQAEALNK
jgi:putative membrane protein